MEKICDFGACGNSLNLKKLSCKHNLCRECYLKSRECCIACEEERINKILVPFMYKLYDWHAVCSGVKDSELMFSKQMEEPIFSFEKIQEMIDLGWKVNNQKKLQLFMDTWEQ